MSLDCSIEGIFSFWKNDCKIKKGSGDGLFEQLNQLGKPTENYKEIVYSKCYEELEILGVKKGIICYCRNGNL